MHRGIIVASNIKVENFAARYKSRIDSLFLDEAYNLIICGRNAIKIL